MESRYSPFELSLLLWTVCPLIGLVIYRHNIYFYIPEFQHAFWPWLIEELCRVYFHMLCKLNWWYCNIVAPRNLLITPRQLIYHPGDRIQCSAEGNPAPSYQWTDLVNKINGTVIQGAVLVISEDMVNGSYVFQCTASNYFNATIYNEVETLNFTVLPTPVSPTVGKQKLYPHL